MRRSSIHLAALLGAAVSFSTLSSARAATFADQVVGYVPGSGVGIYTNASAALGSPSPLTGENAAATPSFGVNVFNAFNPGYQTDEIVRVGEGGSLTLRLAAPVSVGAGPELGLVENVSLFDVTYPTGTTGTPVAAFSADRALVEVSADGLTYVGLTGGAATSVLFDMPATYFLNGNAADTTAPSAPIFADFGKPFAPVDGINVFDSKSSYADLLAAFDGSGGGTWFDVSAPDLKTIRYVRLSVLDDNDDTTINTLEVDSLLTNSALVVPEPALAAGMIGGLGGLIRRRRR